jgi:cytochrome c
MESLQAGAVMTAALVFSLASSAGAQTAGLFTDDQAMQGRQIYFQQCATCHGENLQGKVGPALSGRQFHQMVAAQNMNGNSLFQFVVRQMPQSKPGSLSEGMYVDIFAYILQQNGFASGTHKLTAQPSDLEKINFAQAKNAG